MGRKIVYRGTNAQGNDYVVYDDGSYWYGNDDGTSFANDGNGHEHFTNEDGDDGYHYNSNTDEYGPGRQYRRTDTRHRRHQRRRS